MEIGKRAAVATSEFAQIAAKGITDLAEKTASAVSELSDKVVEAIPLLKEAASELAHQAAEKTSQMASNALSRRSTNEASQIGDKVASDEEVSRQILGIFMRHRIPASGALQRNNFFDVRDGDFQRGLNKAIANNWITIDQRNRYRYELTATGYAVGRLINPATRLV